MLLPVPQAGDDMNPAKAIRHLKRRKQFLDSKLAQPGNYSGRTYDAAECQALAMAIDAMRRQHPVEEARCADPGR